VSRPYRSLGWTRRSDGAYARFRRHHLVTPEGSWVGRDRLHHVGSVAVLPMLDGDVVLVEQWREAAGEMLLEVPAGLLEPGEAPEAAAARECAEETGYLPGRLRLLGRWWTSPGISDEHVSGFVAEALEPVGRAPDGTEEAQASIRRLPLSEALAAVSAGRIRDLKTVAILASVAAAREESDGYKAGP
jgi:8-oxo-dGTP pyrophosphatase MutT (NUDIX family)